MPPPEKKMHEWVMVATFAIIESEVEQLAAARVDPSGEGQHNIQLSQDKMVSLDGPGCRNCGLEWTVGYGQECLGSIEAVIAREQEIKQAEVSARQALASNPVRTSGLILPNGQESGGAGLFLPEGVQMPSAE